METTYDAFSCPIFKHLHFHEYTLDTEFHNNALSKGCIFETIFRKPVFSSVLFFN